MRTADWMIVTVLCAVTCGAGCGNDLPKASRLERTRVLGARVQVASDPGRADAVPGETAAIEWLVAGPRSPASLDWAFALCTGIDGACADAPVLALSGNGTPVQVPFTAPAVVDEVRRPLMIGAVCAGGTVVSDATTGTPACTTSSDSANVARFAIPMTPPGQESNRHPNLANDVVELEGAGWTSMSAANAGDPCDADSGLPTVTAGSVLRHVRVVTDADDRESFVSTAGQLAELEELQVSNFATAGDFDGSYAAVYANDTRGNPDVVLKWTPPAIADVSSSGLIVQFHFVVRDGRGGLDWIHRALCVVPP